MRLSTKFKATNIISVLIILYTIYYIFSLNYERRKLLNDKENVKFTIGIIKSYNYGAKVSNWFSYKFTVNSREFEGKYSASNIENPNFYINKYFVVEYSKIKPKFSILHLNRPVSDSLLNSKKHIWNRIPK